MAKSIYILGVGKFTEVVIDLAQSCGYIVKGLYHYNNERIGQSILDIPIIGCTEDLLVKNSLRGFSFALSMGDNQLRNDIGEQLRGKGASTPNLIHPNAFVSKYATIKEGIHVNCFGYVHTGASVGNDCIVSPHAVVSHHSTVKAGCLISIGAVVGAYSYVGENALVGMNSTIINREIVIGENVIIGVGSVVLASIPRNSVVAGVPATEIYKK